MSSSSSAPAAAPPLAGLRVVEFSGLAPGPFVGLILADFGADVVRIDKVGASMNPDALTRGKRSAALDPKHPAGLAALRRLISTADVLIEPFRPGVMERLGLGPEHVIDGRGASGCVPNERLVYARLTGFQRTGPYATMAGHDINYIALSGVLSMLSNGAARGERNPPPAFPGNLAADFAGGSFVCALGILLALLARARPAAQGGGKGQVVEADMVSGSRYLATFPVLMSGIQHPAWGTMIGKGDAETRGQGVLDGAAPWYGVYKTKDERWMSLGAIEPQFYAELLAKLRAAVPSVPSGAGGSHPTPEGQHDRRGWSALREYFAAVFAQRTRAEWAATFLGSDACCVPVLDRDEALLPDAGAGGDKGSGTPRGAEPSPGGGILPSLPAEAANALRAGEHDPVPPAPAPRLSRTPARVAPGSAPALAAAGAEEAEAPQLLLTPGEHTLDVLREWIGASDEELRRLYKDRAIGAADPPAAWDEPAAKL